jgi:hypothetical protein
MTPTTEQLERHDEPLAPPHRRRAARPAILALSAVLVCAVGFIGGVLVQKGQQGGSGSGATQATGAGFRAGGFAQRRQAGGFSQGGQAGAGGGQAPTAGTVKSKSGRTLYVQDSSGTTVKVRLTGQSKVVRTATSSAGRIHPGDTVVIQGAKAKDGTVKATSLTATAAGTSAGGFGGGFAGGGPPGGGAAPTAP